jgi:hypothetical protein
MQNAPSTLPSDANKLVSKLHVLGFRFGNDSSDLRKFVDYVDSLNKPCHNMLAEQGVVNRALEKEEIEMYEDEQLEKLMLSNLCSDILEEVMDTSSEQMLMARTAVSRKNKGKGRNNGKSASVST